MADYGLHRACAPPGHMDLRVLIAPSADRRALYQAPLALIRPEQIVAWRGSGDSYSRQVLAQASGHPPRSV